MLARADAEAFLYREARLLDDGDLAGWRDLLADDVVYWIPNNRDDVVPERHISIVYNDRRSLEGRLWRIMESGINHSQDPPSHAVRFIGNVEVAPGERAGETIVHCNLLLHLYRSGTQRRDEVPHAHAARCRYVLRGVAGALKIAYKKVTLLELDAPLPPLTFIL
jgi:3-phenylpropionate/cinnamic acid dioxygenase small subunit